MVYISGDGRVCQSPPWSMDRVVKIFYGIIQFIILFFQTLVSFDSGDSKPNSSRGSGSGSFFRGSGGGGGGGGGGGRPHGLGGGGGGPRFRTMSDINPPTVRGVGGCPGGSCGM
ncbi:glycine-rich selenoprotein-like [Anoplophora glabripennis]|uniref:glycine-rich selenoprotein-like n=1 Tax=Anoplophora glabripennis TaxID=217634 RepID=UPI0008754758|nr:glycine-rich selenoprotein-like [Anoplophora glabripennis]